MLEEEYQRISLSPAWQRGMWSILLSLDFTNNEKLHLLSPQRHFIIRIRTFKRLWKKLCLLSGSTQIWRKWWAFRHRLVFMTNVFKVRTTRHSVCSEKDNGSLWLTYIHQKYILLYNLHLLDLTISKRRQMSNWEGLDAVGLLKRNDRTFIITFFIQFISDENAGLI